MESHSPLVISGLSGRYPESENLEIFWSNLLKGIEMCTLDDRYFAPKLHKDSVRIGKMLNVESFDADFFKLSKEATIEMGTTARLIVEVAYEAIYDSGTLFNDWKNRKTGFFFAQCTDDDEKNNSLNDGFDKLNLKTTLPNLCSILDIHGDAALVDTACASMASALDLAIKSVSFGHCDQAIVAGSNTSFNHYHAHLFRSLNMISKDGISKCLDAKANGYCRSESIVAMIVQRKCDAKRVHATIYGLQTNCDGYKPEGITFPRLETQFELFKSTLKDLSLDPLEINYIEAHTTGTQAGDPIECASIQKAYRPDSIKPLYLGCLKSNIGHSEGSAFGNAISKVVKIFQTGLIPANINYGKPNPRIEGLINGILVPVLENKPFDGDIIPVHALGFGGVNAVAILKANAKRVEKRDQVLVGSDLHRLVHFCNRTFHGLESIANFIEEQKGRLTKYTLALINDLSKDEPSFGFNHRGYAILDKNQSIIYHKFSEVKEVSNLWFIFTPIYNTSYQFYQQLMCLPIFRRRLEALNSKLWKSKGINIIEMIKNAENNFNSQLVSSTAIQIVLYDFISKDLNILPNGIIGHSLGSIAAAYADNCITDELAISIAHQIATICSTEFNQKTGLMININLPWKELEIIKSKEVDIASCESNDWTIISGLKQPIESFLSNLDEKIAIKILKTNNIPFHSSTINHTAHLVGNSLAQLKLDAKHSSNSLLFTSVDFEKGSSCLINEDFFKNLLISSCNLNELLHSLPTKSVCITFGNMINDHENFLSLLDDFSIDDPIDNLLQSVGRLYLNGLDPAIENLYEKVDYPVPRETPSLGHLIKWNHDKRWLLPKNSDSSIIKKITLRNIIDLNDPDDSFLSGHVIDGRKLFPATGYFYAIWSCICRKHFLNESETSPIELYNVRLHRAIHFGSTMKVEINIKCDEAKMSFILHTGDERNICVTGQYRLVDKPSISNSSESQSDSLFTGQGQELIMESEDIYKEFRTRGYDYSGTFKGILQAASTGDWGFIRDTGHWISFADACTQVIFLGKKSRELEVPSGFEYVYINPLETEAAFAETKKSSPDSEPKLKITMDKINKIGYTNGYIVKGLIVDSLKRRLEVPGNRREYRLFDPFECDIQLTEGIQSNLDEYIDQCLKCIEILKGHFNLEDLNTQQIEKLVSTDSKYYTILIILYEAVKKFKNGEIDALQLEYQQRCNALMKDPIFLDPLGNLIQRSVAVVYENYITGKVNAVALNFLQIQSEVSLNNDTLSNTINAKVEYVVMENFADMIIQSGSTTFSKLNVIGSDEISVPGSVFDLIFVRDSSTYLPIISAKSSASVPNCDTKALMRIVFNSLKEGGFCIMITRTKLTLVEQEFYRLLGQKRDVTFDQSVFKSIIQKIGFTWIGLKHLESHGYCSILLRRPFPVNTEQELSVIRITLDNLEWIDEIKKVAENKNHKIWLVGGGHDNGIIGLTRCLNRDPYGYNVRCYYDPSKKDNEEIRIPDNILAKDYLINYVNENGLIGTFIHQNIENLDEYQIETSHCYGDIRTKGDLSSIRWFHSILNKWQKVPKSKLKVDVESINIYYGALNFKDVMVSTGRVPRRAYPHDENVNHRPSIGMEFSGIDSEGKRVMGMCESGSIGTSLLLDETSTKIMVPDEWTLAQAATVPVVYLTAYYGLIIRGDLRSGETVLIHAGSGGVGQAAISICLARNCEVFTTVGTQAKRDFIKQQFPKIDDEHIGDSRSTSFEEMILRKTNGRGVDLVLNSLSDDKLAASLRCLADFGRFIEIGKYDMIQNTFIDNIAMEYNKTFHACCIIHLREEVSVSKIPDRMVLWDNLIKHLYEGIKSGEVKPLPTTIFEMDKLEEAFRYMATGKHIGKILIQTRDEPDTQPKIYKAIGRTFFDMNKVYIITGGLGGIGLELAFWMSLRGATNLILTSRSGIKNSYQKYMIDRIMNNVYIHIDVEISNEDCHTCESTARLIKMAKEKGPIGGIFHLAMVLKDALFENQTVDTFKECVNPKANACRHLDELARALPYNLDYFVCFSSFANTMGNVGQSNYCFANSSMEQICSKRRQDGLHGLAIELGIVGDVGAVSEYDVHLSASSSSFGVMRLPLLLHTLDKLFLMPYSNCLSIIMADKQEFDLSSDISMKHRILHILGITDESKVDPESTLGDLGLDSLMAIEIKQGLETRYDYSMTTQEIRNIKVSQIPELEEKLKKSEVIVKKNNLEEFDITKFDPIIVPTEIFIPFNIQYPDSSVFFFPEISGSFTDILPVFEQVSRSIIGVSWVKGMEKLNSMDEVTDFYVDAFIEKYHPAVEYYTLIGYSLGGCIAFNVACKLQKKLGLYCIQKLILLDISFDDVSKKADYFRSRFRSADEDNANISLITDFISTNYSVQISDTVHDRLSAIKTSDERYEFLGTQISELYGIKYESSQVKEATDLFYSKVKALFSFKVDEKFHGDIILFRGRDKSAEKEFLTDFKQYGGRSDKVKDYGLSKYITGRVTVHLFKGDHETFIRDDTKRVAAYMESALGELSV